MSVLGSVFEFPVGTLSTDAMLAIEQDLTFKSMDGSKYGFGGQQVVQLVSYADGVVRLPRRYAVERLPRLVEGAVVEVCEGYGVDLRFDEEKQGSRPDLKKRQDKVITEYMAALGGQSDLFKGGLLSAPCGTGKTVVSTKLFSLLGRTVLVIVHKEFLMTQWRDRIKDFLGLADEDIGFVQQDKCEYQGKKIVIAMIQSLIGDRIYPKDFYRYFGVICIDEAHRVAAPEFNKAVTKFPAKYRIGVTATPRRSDGLQEVFEWQLGQVLAIMQGNCELNPQIFQVKFDMYLPERYYIWKNKTMLARLINYIVAVKSRNVWLVDQFVKALAKGRKVMVLSDRRDHLDELASMFAARKTASTFGYYVGGMKPAERDESAKCDLILATYAMAKEGLDIPDIDTLFLSTPKTDVEQSVGRIVRAHPDKKPPMVIDIVDTVPLCEDFGQKRLRQYKKLRYDIAKSV